MSKYIKKILFIIFLFWFHSKLYNSKKCLNNKLSDNEEQNCQACLPNYYRIDFYESLNSAPKGFFEMDCILKLPIKNTRTILIINRECSNCEGFDVIYSNLIRALEEESKIALRFFFC
jgi:hypothetical protein